ncbi:MAG: triose-phosphate isomerase [Candidatus Nanohaloarchaea archaeon]
MIVVNFKTYSQATGDKSEELAHRCLEAAEATGERVVVAPAIYDLHRIEGAESFAQHIDPVEPGSHTGHVLAEGVKKAGASGTILNHSENRMEKEDIQEALERAKENGLETILCAKSPEECEELSELGPDYIAFEPPELIGGETSVSDAKPGLIEEAVERSEVPVLTGAGIKEREDVEKSIELGCEGVLVASGVVKSENPEEVVKELCEGL